MFQLNHILLINNIKHHEHEVNKYNICILSTHNQGKATSIATQHENKPKLIKE